MTSLYQYLHDSGQLGKLPKDKTLDQCWTDGHRQGWNSSNDSWLAALKQIEAPKGERVSKAHIVGLIVIGIKANLAAGFTLEYTANEIATRIVAELYGEGKEC